MRAGGSIGASGVITAHAPIAISAIKAATWSNLHVTLAEGTCVPNQSKLNFVFFSTTGDRRHSAEDVSQTTCRERILHLRHLMINRRPL
jgi:hypothetical protein